MSARLTGDESALWKAAARVLDANWTGAATVPSPGLYPHQWSWDSVFVTMGLARYKRDRAERELVSLFHGQWSDGLLPHIVFNTSLARHAYFPGPDLWETQRQPNGTRTSGLTHPPLHALAALRLHECARDAEASRAFLAHLYPMLVAQHAYLARVRDLSASGLVAICHPWESGLDNSPAWDRPLGAVELPPADYAPRWASRNLPTGEDYDRYVRLVVLLRETGYDPAYIRDAHPFAVEDPLFNASYLASTHALAELAEIIGEDPTPHRECASRVHTALLDRLWDRDTGCFRARDLRAGRLLPVVTVGSFAPLLDPELPEPITRSLIDLLLSARFAGAAGYPVPTCDIQAPAFDRAAYWRGPTWINTNWLLWYGALLHGHDVVADLLYGATLRLVRQSGFREFFDPFDGTGRGSHDYSWSAALVMDLLGARRAPRAA
ncbi:MGH1-like glycoside hydrolase domain-containing protein [Spirillospora sp. CA-294931]|uniref:MGH1-like glycoside hydrolase domain-containing protein n=1 Tax=Spirillospora sp. CA-294931 TaxID=3240042 RepID=UPI003D8F04FF